MGSVCFDGAFFAARFLCTALKVLSRLGSGRDFFHENAALNNTSAATRELRIFLISPKFKNSKEITA